MGISGKVFTTQVFEQCITITSSVCEEKKTRKYLNRFSDAVMQQFQKSRVKYLKIECINA